MHTLSLHDALPISASCSPAIASWPSTARTSAPSTSSSASSRQIREATSPSRCSATIATWTWRCPSRSGRSEEHTSELQSRPHLVCRLLLEKKNAYGEFISALISNDVLTPTIQASCIIILSPYFMQDIHNQIDIPIKVSEVIAFTFLVLVVY